MKGISGPCDMGLSGDRIPYFWIYQFVGVDNEAEIVAISETKLKVIIQEKKNNRHLVKTS
jgi:hypothetical protein